MSSAVRKSTRLSSVFNKPINIDKHSIVLGSSSSCTDDEIENFNMNSNNLTRRRRNMLKKLPPPTHTEQEEQPPKTPTRTRTPKSSIQKREENKYRQSPKVILRNALKDVTDDDSSEDEKDNEIVDVSPPKQQKFQHNSSADKNLFSPTRLLDRLSIEDHYDDVTDDKTAKTTRKEFKINKYQNARRVLNSSETNFLPGRDKELTQLTEFFQNHLENNQSGSLYVSGQPGTGKTACLTKLFNSNEFTQKFIKVYINCTTMSSIGNIYKKICTELKICNEGQRRTEKEYIESIEKYLIQKHRMILLILDEIDQLCGKKQAILYTIFEWPSIQKSKLLLIGIANSLDLTDRLLTRLNSNCQLKPQLLHFPPYTKQQIIDIFKGRLEEAGVLEIFPPITIQLLAAKVAAISGDVRRALDIGRRVIQIAEKEYTTNKSNTDLLQKCNLKEFGIETLELEQKDATIQLRPVQVNQVVSVLNNVYGASQTLTDDIEEDAFPLQQKLLLCSLMLMLRKCKNKDITIGRLHDVYKKVCLKRNIMAVDQSEFVNLCSLVDARGIVRIISKKEPRLNKIVLQWDESEVNGALQDKQLICTILDDVSCLG